MKRIIFLNLLIDRFWGRGSVLDRIFNVPNPESLRLSLISFNLAINFNDKKSDVNKDVYILSLAPDSYWLDQFKEFHQLDKKNYKVVKKDPYLMMDWLKEFSLGNSVVKFNDYVIAGVSDLEFALIHRELQLPLKKSLVNEHKRMNSKKFLLQMASENSIPIPESQIILGKDIVFNVNAYGDKIFKFDNSSGGSGQFDFEKLKLIYNWAQSRQLGKDWDDSVWICQKKISIQNEWSVFSHTDSDDYNVCSVSYDSNFLSNKHYFEKNSKIKSMSEKLYLSVKKSLIGENYQGYFGFDVVSDENSQLFVVDLNLRLTKTHLLQMSLVNWKLVYKVGVFYRKRFLLNRKTNFKDFWLSFCSFFKVNDLGEGDSFRILPFDVFGFSEGKSEITFLIDCDSDVVAESFVFQIDEYINGVFK